MKVSAIMVDIREEGKKEVFLTYRGSTNDWVIDGSVYPKHLKLMVLISDYLKEHEA